MFLQTFPLFSAFLSFSSSSTVCDVDSDFILTKDWKKSLPIQVVFHTFLMSSSSSFLLFPSSSSLMISSSTAVARRGVKARSSSSSGRYLLLNFLGVSMSRASDSRLSPKGPFDISEIYSKWEVVMITFGIQNLKQNSLKMCLWRGLRSYAFRICMTCYRWKSTVLPGKLFFPKKRPKTAFFGGNESGVSWLWEELYAKLLGLGQL